MITSLLLDCFLSSFHVLFIFFNLFGWMSERTLRWHFLCVMTTAFSWVGLGFFYGWGYCVITDWHWQIKESLGERDLPGSYISYALIEYFGLRLSDEWINVSSSLIFASVFILSFVLNAKALRR